MNDRVNGVCVFRPNNLEIESVHGVSGIMVSTLHPDGWQLTMHLQLADNPGVEISAEGDKRLSVFEKPFEGQVPVLLIRAEGTAVTLKGPLVRFRFSPEELNPIFNVHVRRFRPTNHQGLPAI